MTGAPIPERLRAAEDVVCRELAGESVLLDLKSGLYYGLDEVGTRLWALLADRSVDDAIVVLAAEYDVEEPRLRADVEALVAELVSRNLLTGA